MKNPIKTSIKPFIQALAIMFAFTGLAFFAGCAGQTPKSVPPAENRARVNVENGASRAIPREGDYQTDDRVKEFEEENERVDSRAQRIADAVTALAGIDKASVVVTGNRAIVGIELTGELTDESLIKAKEEANRAAKEADSDIDYVSVTASDELIKRINGMSDSAAGSKVPKYNEKMEAIVSELTPRV